MRGGRRKAVTACRRANDECSTTPTKRRRLAAAKRGEGKAVAYASTQRRRPHQGRKARRPPQGLPHLHLSRQEGEDAVLQGSRVFTTRRLLQGVLSTATKPSAEDGRPHPSWKQGGRREASFRHAPTAKEMGRGWAIRSPPMKEGGILLLEAPRDPAMALVPKAKATRGKSAKVASSA